MASARSLSEATASLTLAGRLKPSTPEMEKRLDDSRCRELEFAVEAVAISAVVAKVGFDGGAGEWKDTRCRRVGAVLLGEVMADVVLLVRSVGKCTVGAGVGDTSDGAAVEPDGESKSAKSAAAAMSEARPCMECGLALAGDGPVIESVRVRLDALRNRLLCGNANVSISGSSSGGGGLSHERIVLRASPKLLSAATPTEETHVTALCESKSTFAPTT